MKSRKRGKRPSFKASLRSIDQYVNSFKGLTLKQARDKLHGAKLKSEPWSAGGFTGKQLVATFENYEVRVMFHGKEMVVTSIQVLSGGFN